MYSQLHVLLVLATQFVELFPVPPVMLIVLLVLIGVPPVQSPATLGAQFVHHVGLENTFCLHALPPVTLSVQTVKDVPITTSLQHIPALHALIPTTQFAKHVHPVVMEITAAAPAI